jgi:hypothetical protein
MSSHSWLDVWKVFLDVVSREGIAMQIAIVLGTAFVAVMALEGIRASFFPKRIAESVALREAAPPPQPTLSAAPPLPMPAAPAQQDEIRAAWTASPEPLVYTPPPQHVTVNADCARRSSPRRMRVIGQRKPS